FAHAHPAAVGATLDMGFGRIAMTLHARGEPGLGIVLAIFNLIPLQAGANDLLEGGSRNHFIVMPGKKVLVARVADDELVFGIVERESLGDRLDRFGEAKPGFSDFLQVGFFHRDRSVAKYSQRLRHASDLVATPRAGVGTADRRPRAQKCDRSIRAGARSNCARHRATRSASS